MPASSTPAREADTESNSAEAQLQDAIACVSETRLRAIVAKLAQSNPAIKNALIPELVTTKPKRKHAVSRWEMCAHCKEEFDMGEERDAEECIYHSGKLECNYDAFDEWDERCHGPMDSEETRSEYPENFTWTCCEESGLADGCKTAEHVPAVRKKARHSLM